MIEGDTVYQAARRLDAALAGRVLESSIFRDPSFRALDLSGCRVGSVVSRGKHVLVRAGRLSIHTNLGLGGQWEVYATGERAKTLLSRAACVLQNQDFQARGYDLGFLRVIRTSEEPFAFARLGPDLLGHSWDPAEAVRRLASEPGRPIGTALLDQRLVAGIGDVYRSEVLFLARINPHTPVGQVVDLARLVGLAHELLQVNRDRARRQTAPVATRGQYWVYGRGGLACLRCGDPVVHGSLGSLPRTVPGTVPQNAGDGDGRDAFWCPACQPLPANLGTGTVGVIRAGVRPGGLDSTRR